MKYDKKTKLSFPTLNNFTFDVNYCEVDSIEQFELHTHNEIEFYIGIEGDVSFLVNNNLYPVSFGDVVISRPGEYHHCVCHSGKERKFFCIWLSAEHHSFIYDFFKTQVKANLVCPNEFQKKELIDFCFKLLHNDIDDSDKYLLFFNILQIMKNADTKSKAKQTMPDDLLAVLRYIDNHIKENLQISHISKELYISESTIERRFKEYLNIKPLEFIRKKKLILAAKYLRNGKTVLDAGLLVGYSDNSYFIKLFSSQYGITPYRYKKNNT